MNLPEINMLETVRSEMDKRRGNWPEVCEAAGVGYQWWLSVQSGRRRNPSQNLVQALYDWLRANPSQEKAA